MRKTTKITVDKECFEQFVDALCSPEFVPQMAGGFGPSGFDTLNVSVEHWVKRLTATFPPGITTPDMAFLMATETVSVFGPVMTKLLKSNLS